MWIKKDTLSHDFRHMKRTTNHSDDNKNCEKYKADLFMISFLQEHSLKWIKPTCPQNTRQRAEHSGKK